MKTPLFSPPMKTRFLNQERPPVAGRPGWLGFCRPGRCLPAFLVVTLATCLAPTARGEPLASALDERAEPPVARSAPFTPEVFSLLAVLSLDEKLSLVHGAADPTQVGNVGYLPGVPRLGIPPRRDADAFGIQVAAYATAAPTRLGLGATFDRHAVRAWGQVEGNEGRALGIDLLYGPQVDLTRQPNWQRNDTTYGEDPFLSGQLAIQEVTGIQSRGLMSEVKHFAFYNGQAGAGFGTPGPPPLPTIVDDQTAHELYLKDYEYPVTHAKPSSIMDSYQGVQIVPLQPSPAWASDNPLTLTTILRGQWDFRGFVLSDYGATHSVHALLSGQDQEYPGTGLGGLITSYFATQLKPLVDPTSTSYDPLYALTLEVAVARVLYAYERFGLLECASPAGPVSDCAPPPRPDIDDLKTADATTVERLSEEAAVLLKNDAAALPLQGAALDSVAVIGPAASQTMVEGNRQERARGFPERDAISPLQVLQTLAPRGSDFTYAPGIDWIGTVVPISALAPGLTRTESDSIATRTDATLDYEASGPNDLKPGVTYTWTGTLTVPVTDTYYLWLQQAWLDPLISFAGPSVKVTIDGAAQPLFTPGVPVSTYPAGVVPAHGTNHGVVLALGAGPHQIQITAAIPLNTVWPNNVGTRIPLNPPLTFRLTWSRFSETLNAAVAAAGSVKVAVVFADDNGAANAELVNSLAPNEDALITAVAKANPNTIVVLNTGDPVLMPWLQNVKAVLEMWYPGQEGGTSTARLLLGHANPGGKLPISWPASGDQTPFAGHPERITGDGKEVLFSEGLFMGYRWYDQQHITPLFPFGHGLSYTQFAYSGLEVRPEGDGLEVSFELRNTGSAKGSEAPQVYVGPPSNPPPGVQFALKKLAGFERVELGAGEGKRVRVQVSRRELSYWSTALQRWILPGGERTVYIGASSQDLRLKAKVATRMPWWRASEDSSPIAHDSTQSR
jgi:beta-glucosidase